MYFNNNYFRSALLVIAFLISTTSAGAQPLSNIPAAFVDIGMGARPVALGSAYVGLADDAHSLHWNPAGLAAQSSYQVAFSYIDHLGLLEYQNLAVTVPLGGTSHSLGAGIIATGDDALSEIVAQLAYSRMFANVFSVGVGLKYRRATFGNNALSADDFIVFDADEVAEGLANQVQGNASGFGVDVGLLYTPSPKVRFGLMLRDLYAPVAWNSSTNNPDNPARGSYNEGVPFEAALGTVYRLNNSFLITADYSPALQGELDDKVRVGVETTILNIFSMRGGMQQVLNDRDDEKYALGFGVKMPLVQGIHVMANYTYLIETLANTQHMSLSIQF